MTIKHTPGPWFLETNHMTATARVVADDRDERGQFTEIVADRVAVANAALIAAAPDLLAALQACELRLTHLAQNSVNVIAELKQVRAAIAKATA